MLHLSWILLVVIAAKAAISWAINRLRLSPQWHSASLKHYPILKANHNQKHIFQRALMAVLPITKIQFWKQITTQLVSIESYPQLYYQSQRYNFESKSQHGMRMRNFPWRCITNHKDTILKANHNGQRVSPILYNAVLPITKIQFWVVFQNSWFGIFMVFFGRGCFRCIFLSVCRALARFLRNKLSFGKAFSGAF